MRGVYEANIKTAAITAGHTLLLITVPANKVVEVLSASITDNNNATNQQLEAVWQLVGTLGSPVGTSITPTKNEQGDQAAGSTVLGDLTTEPTSYSAGVTQGLRGFASLAGYEYAPVPEERLEMGGGSTWGLRLLTAAPTSFIADVRASFREIG